MKAVKLIITFIIILGGVVLAFFWKSDNSGIHIDGPSLCDKCKQELASQEKLDDHKSAAHPVFPCDKCGQAFDSEKALDVHKSAAHPVNKYKCCDSIFNSLEALRQHKENAHFVCTECGKDVWFKSQKELDDHKRNNYVKGKEKEKKTHKR